MTKEDIDNLTYLRGRFYKEGRTDLERQAYLMLDRIVNSLSTPKDNTNELENLRAWKESQIELFKPFYKLMESRKDMKLGESMVSKAIELIKERDAMKDNTKGMTAEEVLKAIGSAGYEIPSVLNEQLYSVQDIIRISKHASLSKGEKQERVECGVCWGGGKVELNEIDGDVGCDYCGGSGSIVAYTEPLTVVDIKQESELKMLYDWLMDDNREPAQTAFTSGEARNLAKEIEFRMSKQEPKWVSVEDEMPKEYLICGKGCGESEVLLLSVGAVDEDGSPNPYVTTGTYCLMKECFKTLENERLEWERIKDVTHWMPLPSPPDKEGCIHPMSKVEFIEGKGCYCHKCNEIVVDERGNS